jgi:hypothetical protein
MSESAPRQPSFIDWVKVIVGAVQLLGALITYLRERQLLNAGGAEAIAKILRAQADDLHKIQDTMAAAGKRFDDNNGMPADGKFRD